MLYARPEVSGSATEHIPIAIRASELDMEGLIREIKKYGDIH